MANTYSTRPFISYDGEDDKGIRAEVKVVTGYGNIDSIEPSSAGKSFKVSFSVENTKYFPSGWAPDGSNVLEKIKKAEEDKTPIHFRLETRRQKEIDRSTPIEELSTLAKAKDSIHKSIAAVKFEGDDEWTISPHAVTSMREDPKSTNGIHRADDMDPSKLGGGTGGGNGGGARPTYNGIEPPPYVNRLRDGSVNPGSIAASVPLNLLAFVAEWDRDHAGDPSAQVGEKRQPIVAKALLVAANELQLAIFDGKLETPDLGAGSHTRARALLFETIRAYFPLSAEIVSSKEDLGTWKDSLVEKSLAMWRWSISEVERVSPSASSED